MKLLVLGGTRFLGRHLVNAALERGDRVTVFNRGRSGTPPPGVEHLRGDRDGGLGALDGRAWDAVIDTCGYVPRLVSASARRLAAAVKHYTFVSSLSVYTDWSRRGPDEGAAVGTLADPTIEEVTAETYGPLKALCERAVEEALPERALIVRPGLIVGPHDNVGRFPYWPRRIAQGGEVLAPGSPDLTIQIIDVRDLAGWILRMAERGGAGVFNATGPAEPLTMGRLLETCREVTGADARFTWVDEAFLFENGVAPIDGLPLWVPSSAPGFTSASVSKALAAGLTLRPLSDTVRATFEWDAVASPEERNPRTLIPTPPRLTLEREAELLRAWHARARVG